MREAVEDLRGGEGISGEVSPDGETAPVDGESGASVRPVFDKADRELLPDFTEAASDLSSVVSPLPRADREALGLSVLVPGILDLKALKDLVDSFVSALLKDGYDWRLSAPLSKEIWETPPLGDADPDPLDGWFPIVVCLACKIDYRMPNYYPIKLLQRALALSLPNSLLDCVLLVPRDSLRR